MRAAREGKTHTKALCGSLASLALRTNKHQIKRINWSSASASSCRPTHLCVKVPVVCEVQRKTDLFCLFMSNSTPTAKQVRTAQIFWVHHKKHPGAPTQEARPQTRPQGARGRSRRRHKGARGQSRRRPKFPSGQDKAPECNLDGVPSPTGRPSGALDGASPSQGRSTTLARSQTTPTPARRQALGIRKHT